MNVRNFKLNLQMAICWKINLLSYRQTYKELETFLWHGVYKQISRKTSHGSK